MIFKTIAEFKLNLPSSGPILGLDIGGKKIGLALSDDFRRLSSSLQVININDLNNLSKICIDYNITGIVIGWPLEMNGNEGEACKKILEKANKISTLINLPILLFDERFTTKMANNALSHFEFTRKKRNDQDDKVSANIILQDVLNSFTLQQ
ncbi:MAG: Holliday junction resolvase RuvX [Sphingobacteriia bacterium]|nr:Holliday junction resolvase RuvX [Sphingobacteriia bacterium]